MLFAASEGYAENHEFRADELALKYLRDAGFQPAALISVLKKLSFVAELAADRGTLIPKSHLVTSPEEIERRLGTVKALIEQIGPDEA